MYKLLLETTIIINIRFSIVCTFYTFFDLLNGPLNILRSNNTISLVLVIHLKCICINKYLSTLQKKMENEYKNFILFILYFGLYFYIIKKVFINRNIKCFPICATLLGPLINTKHFTTRFIIILPVVFEKGNRLIQSFV